MEPGIPVQGNQHTLASHAFLLCLLIFTLGNMPLVSFAMVALSWGGNCVTAPLLSCWLFSACGGSMPTLGDWAGSWLRPLLSWVLYEGMGQWLVGP
mmetsp:Transcript_11055/g.16467  ORF Transcript_11055/g.16467 Transcript_11055/m.16467 type:complete len:96 (-) Transcript_11055:639-926(-)